MNKSTESDAGLSDLALTNGELKLYGLADLPEPTIVEFEMPKQLINKK